MASCIWDKIKSGAEYVVAKASEHRSSISALLFSSAAITAKKAGEYFTDGQPALGAISTVASFAATAAGCSLLLKNCRQVPSDEVESAGLPARALVDASAPDIVGDPAMKEPQKFHTFTIDGCEDLPGIHFEIHDISQEDFEFLQENIPYGYASGINWRLDDGQILVRNSNGSFKAFKITPLISEETLNEALKAAYDTFDSNKDDKISYERNKENVKSLKLIQVVLGSEGHKGIKKVLKLLESKPQDYIDRFFSIVQKDEGNSLKTWNGPAIHSSQEIIRSFEYLLASRATLTSETTKRILELAINYNDQELINQCLDFDPSLVNSSIKSRYMNQTLLCYAISCECEDAARLLIGRGAFLGMNEAGRPSNALVAQTIDHIGCSRMFSPNANLHPVGLFLKFLIEKGAPVEGRKNRSTESGADVPYIEWVYFTKSIPKDIKEILILETGIELTGALVRDLKVTLRIHRDPEIGQALLRRKLITEAELNQFLNPPEKGTLESLLAEAVALNEQIQHESQIHHGSPMSIDPNLIFRARELKKEIKSRIKLSQINPDAIAKYEAFTDAYDSAVERHPFFRALKKASEEIRKFKRLDLTPSLMAVRMFSLLSGLESCYTDSSSKAYLTDHTAEESIQHMWDHLSEQPDLDPLTWVHGTKSGSLAGLMKTNGILSMGKLIETGIATFAGENVGSEANINRDKVSGEILTPHFDEAIPGQFYYEASTRLLVSVLYAMKTTGYGRNDKTFNPDAARTLTSPNQMHILVKRLESDDLNLEAFSGIRIAVMRLRQYDSNADIDLTISREIIEKSKEDPALSAYTRLKLEELHNAFTVPIEPLREQEKIWINQSYPIVFASSKLEPTPLGLPDTAPEYMVKQALFGKDIQYAFTSQEHVEDLQKTLDPYKIRVMPFEVILREEAVHMARGSERIETNELIRPKNDDQFESLRQMRIAQALEWEVLPRYSIPLPEKPVYVKNGIEIAIKNPYFGHQFGSHKEYLESCMRGQTLFRSIHGRVHATRVAMAAQIVNNLTSKSPLSEYAVLAAASHDWMRQDEGVDHWDEESGQKFYHLALKLGMPQNEAEELRDAIIFKDPHDGKYASQAQKALHDADCLEIHRVLENPSNFNPNQLQFYHSDDISLDDKKKVIAEWKLWCYATESESFKKQIEWHSDFTYIDMMRVLKHFKNQFPSLTKLMEKELSAYDKEPPSRALIECVEVRLKTKSS